MCVSAVVCVDVCECGCVCVGVCECGCMCVGGCECGCVCLWVVDPQHLVSPPSHTSSLCFPLPSPSSPLSCSSPLSPSSSSPLSLLPSLSLLPLPPPLLSSRAQLTRTSPFTMTPTTATLSQTSLPLHALTLDTCSCPGRWRVIPTPAPSPWTPRRS